METEILKVNLAVCRKCKYYSSHREVFSMVSKTYCCNIQTPNILIGHSKWKEVKTLQVPEVCDRQMEHMVFSE